MHTTYASETVFIDILCPFFPTNFGLGTYTSTVINAERNSQKFTFCLVRRISMGM